MSLSFTAYGYSIGITKPHPSEEKRDINPDRYVEIEEDAYFGVYGSNQTNQPCRVEIYINDDYQGRWVLVPGDDGVIYNPLAQYGTGQFKAVRKGSENWEAGAMDQVAEEDQGVVRVVFTPGERAQTQPQPQPRPPLKTDKVPSPRSMNVSSSTHDVAGVVLEGDSVQQFEVTEYTFLPTGEPTTLEVRLAIKKKKSGIRPTGPRTFPAPPAL